MSLTSVIAGTRLVVTDNPALSHAAFDAQGTVVGVTEIDIQTGEHTFKVDEPLMLGGTDTGPNPFQYALGALASCLGITYCYWGAQLGIPFDALTVRVEGDADIRGFWGFDDTVRPGFSAVRASVIVTGQESDERYAELAAAVEKHSPVLDVFQNPVPVTLAPVSRDETGPGPAGEWPG
jgi:uncharacterized OsmC-like protein